MNGGSRDAAPIEPASAATTGPNTIIFRMGDASTTYNQGPPLSNGACHARSPRRQARSSDGRLRHRAGRARAKAAGSPTEKKSVAEAHGTMAGGGRGAG